MNYLKKLRVSQQLSVEGLAAKSGVAPNTISNLERKTQNARPGTIFKLASALGVEYEELMFLETQATGPKNQVAA